ncbi:MAG: hypothetical protein AAF085_17410 [Planctomycetota bacterium]
MQNPADPRNKGIARLATVLVVLLLVAGGGVWLFTSGVIGGDTTAASRDTPQWAEVRMEAIPITVVAEGDRRLVREMQARPFSTSICDSYRVMTGRASVSNLRQ